MKEAPANPWSLYSWKAKPIKHQPAYSDKEELATALKEVDNAPRIVSIQDILSLQENMKQCGLGEKMLIHLGDWAETFKDCTEDSIRNRVVLYTLCSLIIKKVLKKDAVKIGRIAGQYAKPRSSPVEVVNGETISSYFGDNINSFGATKEERLPDPQKMLKGYYWAVATYHNIERLQECKNNEICEDVLEDQLREQTFMDNENPDYEDFLNTVRDCAEEISDIEDLFISHEGLLLDYESRMTRLSKISEEEPEKYFNTSAHFLWVGERTNRFDQAHIEYFKGIQNPVGIKIGPKSDPADIVKSIVALNPENEMGRVTAILRLGAKNVEENLPPLIEEIARNKLNVVWVSDAVHGNTYVNDWKFKVRHVDTVMQEILSVYTILKQHDQQFGGVHLEVSGDNVTECLGGITKTSDDDLYKNYRSQWDPRLNFFQTLHLIYKLCNEMNKVEIH